MNQDLQDTDRGGAVLAHLSGYAGYVLPCGGLIVPFIISLTSRSLAVAVIARQALMLNLLGFLSLVSVLGAYLAVAALQQPMLQVLLAVPAVLWTIVVIVLVAVCPLWGAILASRGQYFRYPIFGISMPSSS